MSTFELPLAARRTRCGLSSLIVAVCFAATPFAAFAQGTVKDPMNDPRYQSGLRDFAPPEVPDELKSVDALTRATALKRLVACADPYDYPSSEATKAVQGYDVDLFKALTAAEGWEPMFYWVNTGTRGGFGRAFRQSISKGMCDVFLGMSSVGDEDRTVEKAKLVLAGRTFGASYVFVAVDPVLKDVTVADLRSRKARVGVTMLTPTEAYVRSENLPHELYTQTGRIVEALVAGDIQVAMIPSTFLATARRDWPDRTFHVMSAYTPGEGFHWNLAWAVPGKEKALAERLSTRLASMREAGTTRDVLARYSVPYFAPFPEAK
jgi:ABC-type amino acid transport substrate-binding protein